MKEKVIGNAEPIRPFCLEYVDAKKEVLASIRIAMQKHNVPMFLMENILSEALHRVREGAEEELSNAARSYQKQLIELQKSKEKEENDDATGNHKTDA